MTIEEAAEIATLEIFLTENITSESATTEWMRTAILIDINRGYLPTYDSPYTKALRRSRELLNASTP